MEDLAGILLDHFQILELLGCGGMGAVYKARDLRLQRDVAVKVMHPHIAEQGDFKERFLQEARSAARLDHPGIVNVYHFGQARSLLYIVMQYIPGANLRDMLEALRERGAWVPLDEAVELVRQLCSAVDYAHGRGVLHRDIKPKNIMIEPESTAGLLYRPVITDLGLAKLADSDFVTRPGSSMGTPAYMSPEQALGRATDARSDVYSLGVLLYELAVGRVPFPAKTITEAIRYHTEETPPAPRSLRPDLPTSLEIIILKALEKDPGARYPDAAELAMALESVTAAATEIAQTPTVLGSAISLMTQYQDSLIRSRGPSLLEEFDTPVDVRQDSVQILYDGVTTTVALPEGVIKIGRHDDNDLVLDDPKASRHHVQIELDGTDYRVVDLGSSNGTYLANAKLLPGVSEVWTPDKPIRIGDTVLRLVRLRRETSGTALRSRVTSVSGQDVHTSAGEGWVGILLQTPKLSVEPGASAVIAFIVLNQSPLVDHYQVSVEGVPQHWVKDIPPPVHLLPGQQQSAALTLQPPRLPESRAGDHRALIRVTSQSNPSQKVEAVASLTVAAYHQLGLEIRPGRQSGLVEGDFTLTVRNECNTELTVHLDASDIEDACHYNLVPSQLIAPAGQERAVKMKVRPNAPLRGASAKTYAFTVTGRVDEAPGLYEQVRGIWVQTPPEYSLTLHPETVEGRDRGEFAVQVVNLGQADLALDLEVLDTEGQCRFELYTSHISLPAGHDRSVPLHVYSRVQTAADRTTSHVFTVTAKPSAVDNHTRQVKGEWRHTAPTAAPASRTADVVQPITPAATAPVAESKPRRFWGCVVLALGLLFTLALFFIAANLVGEGLGLGETGAWVGGIIAAIIGLVGTIRATRRALRGAAVADQPRSSPIAADDEPKPRRFWGAVVFLICLAVTFGLGLVAGNIAGEALGWDDAGAWFAAGFFWFVGFLTSVRLARKVWQAKT